MRTYSLVFDLRNDVSMLENTITLKPADDALAAIARVDPSFERHRA